MDSRQLGDELALRLDLDKSKPKTREVPDLRGKRVVSWSYMQRFQGKFSYSLPSSFTQNF
jgi:hypothetical protein